MTMFRVAHRRSTLGAQFTRLTAVGATAFAVFIGGPGPAAAQQPPRRFFVVSREAENVKDGLTVIEGDGNIWTPLAKELARGGRLSPDTTKYAWLQPGLGEIANTKTTLIVRDLQNTTEPVTVELKGMSGRCHWSRGGRELIVTTYSLAQNDLTYQTWRVAADGSKCVKLPIPATEMVQDWSSDGQWLATTSSRHAAGEKAPVVTQQDIRIIHPDGTGDRVFHRLAGSSSQDAPGASANRKRRRYSRPIASRSSGSRRYRLLPVPLSTSTCPASWCRASPAMLRRKSHESPIERSSLPVWSGRRIAGRSCYTSRRARGMPATPASRCLISRAS